MLLRQITVNLAERYRFVPEGNIDAKKVITEAKLRRKKAQKRDFKESLFT